MYGHSFLILVDNIVASIYTSARLVLSIWMEFVGSW